MFFVYVLQSIGESDTYIGYTNNLRRRFTEHNNGEARSTKSKKPWKLVYYEAYQSQGDAKHREKQLKRFAQAHKALMQRIKHSIA